MNTNHQPPATTESTLLALIAVKILLSQQPHRHHSIRARELAHIEQGYLPGPWSPSDATRAQQGVREFANAIDELTRTQPDRTLAFTVNHHPDNPDLDTFTFTPDTPGHAAAMDALDIAITIHIRSQRTTNHEHPSAQ